MSHVTVFVWSSEVKEADEVPAPSWSCPELTVPCSVILLVMQCVRCRIAIQPKCVDTSPIQKTFTHTYKRTPVVKFCDNLQIASAHTQCFD